jgi:hypothetical protein
MGSTQLSLLDPVPDAVAAPVRQRQPGRVTVTRYVEGARKAIRKFNAAAPEFNAKRALTFEGRLLHPGSPWAFDTASPYAALLVRSTENAEPPMQFPLLPANTAAVGAWLELEIRDAIEKVKVAAHVKEKGSTIEQRLNRMSVVGLDLSHGDAHVIHDLDPVPDALVDPRYLLPGLGLYPAQLLWAPDHQFVAVVTSLTVYLMGVRGR